MITCPKCKKAELLYVVTQVEYWSYEGTPGEDDFELYDIEKAVEGGDPVLECANHVDCGATFNSDLQPLDTPTKL